MKCFLFLLVLAVSFWSTSSAKNAPSVVKTPGAISSQGDGDGKDYRVSTRNSKTESNLKKRTQFNTERNKSSRRTKTKQNTDQVSCGAGPNVGNRIYNGTNAVEGDWPSMVSVELLGRHHCGGTLLDDLHVLTAAHCISDYNVANTDRLTVSMGTTELQVIGSRLYPVEKVYKHPGYETKYYQHDIAVLKLTWPVLIDRSVSPICLPKGPYAEEDFAKENGTIIGWGRTMNPNKPYPTKLQQGSITILQNSACKKKFSISSMKIFGNTMICGFNPQQDVCKGDSGGPIFYQPEKGEPWLQIGIVSYGFGCLHPYFPGVYTRVTYYLDWINEQIKKSSEKPKLQKYKGLFPIQ